MYQMMVGAVGAIVVGKVAHSFWLGWVEHPDIF